jgi:hypothetical protein
MHEIPEKKQYCSIKDVVILRLFFVMQPNTTIALSVDLRVTVPDSILPEALS